MRERWTLRLRVLDTSIAARQKDGDLHTRRTSAIAVENTLFATCQSEKALEIARFAQVGFLVGWFWVQLIGGVLLHFSDIVACVCSLCGGGKGRGARERGGSSDLAAPR